MGDGNNSKLLRGDLIDDAVREPTENISPTSATEFSSEQRIGQDKIGCSLKLRHKRESKLNIRLQRIERGRIV